MSIARNHITNTIRRLIPDPDLCEQMIDLHLGKLTPDDVRRIREERENEAEEILKIEQTYSSNECIFESKTIIHDTDKEQTNDEKTPHIINGQTEHSDS